jgi:ATP-binding cassette subfamily B protein
MGRINSILLTEPEITDPIEAEHLTSSEAGASLEARSLSFSYPGRKEPVLREISFSIRPGEKVALVGRTGSGKSTLLHLIPRLRQAEDSTLFLDGHDINRLRLRDLRTQLGFVPQETFLFTRSLAQNIAFDAGGSDGAETMLVEEAGRLARLSSDILEFPKGYETVVGERGITLSGGQKQRTAIARALLRRPRLLVLDDALSAVDARTEGQILDGIFSDETGRTVIIVSHRLSTVRRAGRILVLDEGRLVESGTHDDLLAKPGGVYRHLVERQLLAEELEKEQA